MAQTAAAAASTTAAETPKPSHAHAASLLGGLAIPLTLFAAAAGMGGPLNGALLLGVYGAHLAAATQAHSALLRQLGLRARPLATLLASLLTLRLYWHWAMSVLPPQHVVGVTVKHQLHMPTVLHHLLASPTAAAWTQVHYGLPVLLALALATGAALLAAEGLGRAVGAALRLLALRRAPSVPGTQLLQPEQPPAAAAAAAEAAPMTPESHQALREWAPIEADSSPVTRLRSAGHANSEEKAEQPPPDASDAAGGERVSLSAADVQELRCISEGGSAAGASLRKWLEQRARDPAFARAAGQAQATQAAQPQPPSSPYWTAAESEALRARAARTGDSVVLAWLEQQRGGGGGAAELAAALEGGSDWDSEEEQEAALAAAEPAEPGRELPRGPCLTLEQAEAELQRSCGAAASEGAAKAEAAATLQASEQGEAALLAASVSTEMPQPATAEQPLEPQPLAATAVDELQTGGLEAETDAKPAAEDAGEVPQPAHQEQEQASEAGDAFEVPIQLLPPPAQQPAAAAPKPQPAAKAAEQQEGGSADASEAVRQLTPAAAREDGFAVPTQTAPDSFVLPVAEAPDAGEGKTAPLEAAGQEQPASMQQPAKAEPAGKQAAAAAVFQLPITEVPDADALQALRQRCEAAKQAAQRAAERADAAEQQTNLGRKQRKALRRTRQEAWDAYSQLRAQLLQVEAEAAEAGDKAQQQP